MFMKLMIVSLATLASLYIVDACNGHICGRMVSKCQLIKCCDCDMSDKNNCSCCMDCALCLSKLYTECCSCVGLCPPPDPNDSHLRSSSIEDLPDPIPGLFNALTEQEDIQDRWSSFTYAVDLDKVVFENNGQSKTEDDIKIIRADHKFKHTVTPPTSSAKEPVLGIRNCTVAFFPDCLSITKCKDSCTSMGAAKYRWFHEHGCCQCVGSSCYDYGLSQPHCLHCPEKEDLRFREENLYADAAWRSSKKQKRNKHRQPRYADPSMGSH